MILKKSKSNISEWFKYAFKKTSKAVTVYRLKQDPVNAFRIGLQMSFIRPGREILKQESLMKLIVLKLLI